MIVTKNQIDDESNWNTNNEFKNNNRISRYKVDSINGKPIYFHQLKNTFIWEHRCNTYEDHIVNKHNNTQPITKFPFDDEPVTIEVTPIPTWVKKVVPANGNYLLTDVTIHQDQLLKIRARIYELNNSVDHLYRDKPDGLIDEKSSSGMKFDTDKLKWSLLPFSVLTAVVRVLMFGAKKYKPFNWQQVHPHRYRDAIMRHWFAWLENPNKKDEETGESHLAHMCCCLLYLMWHEINNKKGE